MTRHNALILYTDQQRWDTLHCAGNPHIHTPNLDQLAAAGTLFQNAFCNNPVCMPSRMSMLSGQYPSSVGVCCNGVEMPEDVPTLATFFKAAGYHTANIGKLHFKNHSNRDHSAPHPPYDFETLIVSDEPGCYDDAYIDWVRRQDPAAVERCRCSTPPAWKGEPRDIHPRNTHEPYLFDGPEELTHTAFVGAETERFLREQNDGRPFFCVASFFAPHAPLNPPKRFVDMYDPTSLPLPHMNSGENTLGLSDEQWQIVKAYYYAMVTHVDEQVGRILNALEEIGQRKNTVIVFTSDHGEHLGDHGRVQKGPPGYDSCTHVPLIIAAPGCHTEKNISGLTESIDIAPTLTDLCGLERPDTFQGRTLAPLLRGRTVGERSSAFMEYRVPFGPSWKTVRTHTHKLCTCNDGTELLYDLAADPHELHNRADDERYREILQAMREELLTRWFTVEKQYPLKTGEY